MCELSQQIVVNFMDNGTEYVLVVTMSTAIDEGTSLGLDSPNTSVYNYLEEFYKVPSSVGSCSLRPK